MKCGYCNTEGHSIRTCCATDCMIIVEKANECLNSKYPYNVSINSKAFMFYKILLSMEDTFLKMSLARLNRNKYSDSFYRSINRQITTLSKHEIVCHLIEDYFYRFVLFKQYQQITTNELEHYCSLWTEIRNNAVLMNEILMNEYDSNNIRILQNMTEEIKKHERITDTMIAKFTENSIDALWMELSV